MTTPNCYLDEDGEHFWFDHECLDVGKEWTEKGHPLDSHTIIVFQNARNHHLLPLGGDGWKLVQRNPLTIAPSILCKKCGVHGFFRKGQWIPV